MLVFKNSLLLHEWKEFETRNFALEFGWGILREYFIVFSEFKMFFE